MNSILSRTLLVIVNCTVFLTRDVGPTVATRRTPLLAAAASIRGQFSRFLVRSMEKYSEFVSFLTPSKTTFVVSWKIFKAPLEFGTRHAPAKICNPSLASQLRKMIRVRVQGITQKGNPIHGRFRSSQNHHSCRRGIDTPPEVQDRNTTSGTATTVYTTF